MEKMRMYWSIEEARDELIRRQKDKDLLDHIEKWRSKNNVIWPDLPECGPSAFFARQIATCRFEDVVFHSIVKFANLTPVWIEFVKDKFVASSPYKKSLVHRHYCSGRGRKGGWKIKKYNGINIADYDGKALSEISMSNGKNLVEYHHEMQDAYFDNPVRRDLSDYLHSIGRSDNFYYPFLSIFLLQGILVDDYHCDNYHNGVARESDARFTRKVFEPAWQKIVDELGIQPLIVPLPWVDGMQFFPGDDCEKGCVIHCDDVFKGLYGKIK